MKYTMSFTSGMVAAHLIILGFSNVQPSLFTGVLGMLVVVNWVIWMVERK